MSFFSCFGRKAAVVDPFLGSQLLKDPTAKRGSDFENTGSNSANQGPNGEHDFLLSTAVAKDDELGTCGGETLESDTGQAMAHAATPTLPTAKAPPPPAPARPEPPPPPPEWSRTWRPTESSALLGSSESFVPPPCPLSAPSPPPRASTSCASATADLGPHVPGSQSTVTLLCPHISQLSRMLSCGGSSFLPLDDSGVELVRLSSAAAPAGPPPPLPPPLPDYLGAAALQQVFLPRLRLVPLAAPECALEDAAQLLDGPAQGSGGGAAAWNGPGLEAALCALLVLRRVAIHHRAAVAHALPELAQLLVGGWAAGCGGHPAGCPHGPLPAMTARFDRRSPLTPIPCPPPLPPAGLQPGGAAGGPRRAAGPAGPGALLPRRVGALPGAGAAGHQGVWARRQPTCSSHGS